MGACFSSNSGYRQPTANVVSPTGDLYRFETPVTVSEVLLHLIQISSSSHSKTFFLSNSDSLSYDEQIPVMSPDEELIANQIYFVFPNSKLESRLSASDMAVLAVKASLALDNSSKDSICLSSSKYGQDSQRGKNKISPYMESESTSGDAEENYYNYATVKSGGIGFSGKAARLERSGSMRKLSRYSSKRAKMVVRSFRLKLSTIQEGSVVLFF